MSPLRIKRSRIEAVVRRYKVKKGGKVAPQVRRYVKRCMDGFHEPKFKTTAISAPTFAANTATIFADGGIYAITQGTTDTTRIGNAIRVQYVRFRGYCNNSTNPERLRVIAFWDRQAQGGTTASDVLAATNDVFADYNHDTVVGFGGSRIEILYDRQIMLLPNYSTAATYTPVNVWWSGNKVVHLDNSTGTSSDLADNNFGMLIVAASASTATTIQGNLFVKYRDD